MSKKHGKKNTPKTGDDLRLNPEKRLVSKFNTDSIAQFRGANPKHMGMCVLDNCAEEHIM